MTSEIEGGCGYLEFVHRNKCFGIFGGTPRYDKAVVTLDVGRCVSVAGEKHKHSIPCQNRSRKLPEPPVDDVALGSLLIVEVPDFETKTLQVLSDTLSVRS